MIKRASRPVSLSLVTTNQQRSNAPIARSAEIITLDGPMAVFGPLQSRLVTSRWPQMANFLDNYEDVATRIKRIHDNYPLCRFNVRELHVDFEKGYCYAVTEIYRDANDEHPAAVDVAFEARSDKGVNRDFWVENCLTSSYGRSAGLLLGSDKRPTKQDMEKVERLSFTVSEVTGAESLGTSLELIKDKLGATELPEAPICNHGHMIHRSGKAKATGKEWQGYMCTEKVKDKQCDPVWLKQTATGSWYMPKPELADHL